MKEHKARVTPAWVLHPDITSDRSRRAAGPALEEAVALAAALPGLEVLGSSVVRLPKPHPGALFGSGKIEELKTLFKEQDVELVLVDGPVSPVQQRNLEKAWGVKLLDRTGLILEIFSDRAATREGVLQVEMAALSYQRTRLVRAWTHLERQRGGLGFVGGPGETQIEADRRAIDDQLVNLRRQLDKVVKTRSLHRAARAKVPYPIVALVGYTNAGKSTLFNRIADSGVYAADKLFATLDTTLRRIELAGGEAAVLADTVGFIRDLPPQLVAAFRSTLEEVIEADLLIHVIDASDPARDDNAREVQAVLEALGAESVPQLRVYNKIDRRDLPPRLERDDDGHISGVWLSAGTGEGIDLLRQAIAERVRADQARGVIELPATAGRLRAKFYELGDVLGEEMTAEGRIRLAVELPRRELERLYQHEGLNEELMPFAASGLPAEAAAL